MSERAQLVAELVGGLLIVAGAALVSIPAALVFAGIAMIALGNASDRR